MGRSQGPGLYRTNPALFTRLKRAFTGQTLPYSAGMGWFILDEPCRVWPVQAGLSGQTLPYSPGLEQKFSLG